MLGFFEWISDEMSPPGDAYDPAVGRPRCKRCGKDAWLMWTGKYSAYCSTECQNSDKRKEPLRSSENSLLPSRESRKPAKVNAFERALAAKKAARDIKAIAEKWTAERKEELKDNLYAYDAQQRKSESTGTEVRKGDSFAQRQAEEAEFHKMQAHLAQVAQALAQEQLRCQEEKSQSCLKPTGTIQRPVHALVARESSSNFLSAEAAALEQAFAEELNRQAEEDEKERKREVSGKALAQTRDLPQSGQTRPSASSSRYTDKTIQGRMQTPEESSREDGNARNGLKNQRRTKNDDVHKDWKQRLDEKGYERNGHRATLAATAPSERGATYRRRHEHRKQSTTEADDRTSCSGRRHIPFGDRCRDCIRRELGKYGSKRAVGDLVCTRKERLHNGKNTSTTSLEQQPGVLPFAYRHPAHAPPRAEPAHPGLSEAPCADAAKLDKPFPTKSRRREGSHQHRPARKHFRALRHVQQGDMASDPPQQDTSEWLRVAGTSTMYVTLDDLKQLREAAWRQAEMAMEQMCACSVRGQYAGNLNVNVSSVENVNPSRVSVDDRLYVVVRCQVAEAEWVEKRSKCVKTLRWDESLSFPVMYEQYPRGGRVYVQLWREAPHDGDVDLFVGEGEVPFPRTETRVALQVQLCWNTKLGGNVVDLDCGRLKIAVHFRARTHAGEANMTPGRTKAISITTKETLNGRQQTTTLLPTRALSKGKQKATVRPRNFGNTSGFQQTEARKPGKRRIYKKSARSHKDNLSVEGEVRKVAEGRVDLTGRRMSSGLPSSHANMLGICKESVLLSPIEGLTKEDQNGQDPGDKESSRTTEMQRAQSERHTVRQESKAAVTENKSEYSNAEEKEHPLHEKGRVSEDAETAEQQGESDFFASGARVSSTALPVGTVAYCGSKASAEVTITRQNSRSSDKLASGSSETHSGTVNSGIRGKYQECLSNVTVFYSRNGKTISNARPSFQGPSVGRTLPSSVFPHYGISDAELKVLLPVVLAQMDDFAHFDAEPVRIAAAANLDPCVLVRPWCKGREKRTRCANRACRRIISNRFMNDLFEEEEFRAWGCCSTCQGEMFHTKVSSSTNGDIHISMNAGMYDEFTLESFIPLAFPTLSVIWPSSRHLYVAQRFTHVQIQDRLRQCKTQRELTFTLMAPLLKFFARSDWSTYRRVALRTCVQLKIQQHPRLQLLLASTGQAVLYGPAVPDFWEWESEDEAVHANLVGMLLMELRNEYI